MVWRMLKGGLPTRELLVRRGIIGNNASNSCVLCPKVQNKIQPAHPFGVHLKFEIQMIYLVYMIIKGMLTYLQ